MSVEIPVVNAGLKYVNGLVVSNNATTPNTKVDIALGQARDSTNVNDITLSASVTVNAATTGANGLDTGSLGNNKLYAVFVIGSSASQASTAGLLSLSGTAPALPANYDMFRRIGWVLTDGSAHFVVFQQVGNGSQKTMWYGTAVATDIVSGTSSTYAAVDMTTSTYNSVPAQATEVKFLAAITANAAADKLYLQPTGGTGDYAIMSADVAAVVTTGMISCPCNATPAVKYKVTASTTGVALSVQAYVDQL